MIYSSYVVDPLPRTQDTGEEKRDGAVAAFHFLDERLESSSVSVFGIMIPDLT